MKVKKGTTIIQWIKNPKFWSSVMILFVILMILSPFNFFNPSGLGSLLDYYSDLVPLSGDDILGKIGF